MLGILLKERLFREVVCIIWVHDIILQTHTGYELQLLMIKKSVLIFFHNGYDFDKHIIYIPSLGTNNYMREKI